ncbi:hypothetical protein [Nocardia sp. NPDC050406]|uniref:hypothetical protein n=1 Tax=Nocardia sp. NPDC050406 TaxID=3364318 RepID=UPI0037A3F039
MIRALILAAGVLLVGCGGAVPDSPWVELSAPASGARVLDFVRVEDGVLAVGSIPTAHGRGPAAWHSGDGRRWRAVSVHPSSPYAFAAQLISAGRGDRIVALGQAFGGAHSNPRMTVWSGDADTLVEHPQVVEMFGGPKAIAVSGAAALGGTSLLVGGWDGPGGRYGAAVWTSADGAVWQRRADDPALTSAPGEQTGAADVTTGPSGFVLVGQTLTQGRSRPLQWISGDGVSWRRIELKGDDAVASRVGCDSSGCLVLGQTLGASPRTLCWTHADAAPVDGPAASVVDISQILRQGGEALAVTRLDGTAHLASLTANCTDWQDIPLPVRSADARIVALPDGLLVATTDDDGSRLWLRSETG